MMDHTMTTRCTLGGAVLTVVLLCVTTHAASSFDAAMQHVQQCQGMALGRQATQGCLASIDSSFNVLGAAFTGTSVTQVVQVR